MKPSIELSIARGVKRFVLLTGTAVPKGGPAMGRVHEYLAERGVDYAVLRTSWFFENFAEQFLSTILKDDFIYSAARDGRVPFVSADDIAEVALKALTEDVSHNSDYIIVGPEAYSYEEVAALLTDVLGRKIAHKRLSNDEAQAKWISFHVPEELAVWYTAMEEDIARGREEAFLHMEQKQVGRRHLLNYFRDNCDVWIPK